MQLALRACVAIATLAASVGPSLAGYDYTDQDRLARWQDLRAQIFGDRTLQTDDRAIQLDATETAPDAAPRTIKLRVRDNHLTDMHAFAETEVGKLIGTTRFVKASGGCSAPLGMSDDEAMRGMGEMRLKLGSEVAAGKSLDATLMIWHPNFNGMRLNEEMHLFTPPRYIQAINVTFDDKRVFPLDTDISLATNPVISFVLLPSTAKGDPKVDMRDSKNATWSKSFPVPSVSN